MLNGKNRLASSPNIGMGIFTITYMKLINLHWVPLENCNYSKDKKVNTLQYCISEVTGSFSARPQILLYGLPFLRYWLYLIIIYEAKCENKFLKDF